MQLRRTIRTRPRPPANPLRGSTLHPVLQRIYHARGVTDPNALDRGLHALIPSEQLSNSATAARLIADAIVAGRSILIVGDFDADGATSCAVAVRALRAMGAEALDYLVPDRVTYGYGLSPEIVEVARARAPELLITVDNGVSSIAGVAAAKAAGMQVIVTDHHLPGAALPAADAIVNPALADDPFPSKCLAGVGVIFYVMSQVRVELRRRDWFAARGLAEPRLAELLDLVALGTVADVVPLDRNNRILVEQGLRRIRQGHCVPGITALLEAGGRRPERLTSSDLGFVVGPRLNAAGRLDDMSIGIECLLADSAEHARELAAELDGLNRERRAIEAKMRAQAIEMVRGLTDELAGGPLPRGLCLFDEDWHQGVVGLVASRIKERLYRPVIAFAPGDGSVLKGSARSIPSLHIRDALDTIATRHPELLQKFGGHAMAAGLSLERERLDGFRRAFEDHVAEVLSDDDLEDVLLSDGELASGEMSLELAEALARGGPWGQGFPEPIFHGEFEVLEQRVVGERHLKLLLRPYDGQLPLDAIAFHADLEATPERMARVLLAYRLEVNDYRGQRQPQLVSVYYEPH